VLLEILVLNPDLFYLHERIAAMKKIRENDIKPITCIYYKRKSRNCLE